MPNTVIGLTGGIGSGKSTVARMLADLGAGVIDADQLAHSVTAAGGLATPAIARSFGSDYLTSTGELDRVKMRALVFDNPAAREQLQSIIHPLVGQAVKASILSSTQSLIVLDIPLLVESGHWRKQCDWVLVVDCSESTQLSRVSARNGWPDRQTLSVIRAQAGRDKRLTAADMVLDNDHVTLPALFSSVKTLGDWLGL